MGELGHVGLFRASANIREDLVVEVLVVGGAQLRVMRWQATWTQSWTLVNASTSSTLSMGIGKLLLLSRRRDLLHPRVVGGQLLRLELSLMTHTLLIFIYLIYLFFFVLILKFISQKIFTNSLKLRLAKNSNCTII